MNRDWFMNYAEYAVRAINIETHWYELRGWITKNGRHILIGDDGGGSSGGAGGKAAKKIDKTAKSDIIKLKDKVGIVLRLKHGTKYILPMISIGCISLVLINFVLKDNSNKIMEGNTSKIIVESPKNKDDVNKEGTRVTIPSTYGKSVSPVQPLPVPDSNTPIVINPL